MQTLAAYLFETSKLDAPTLSGHREAVLQAIDGWLRSKKVDDPRAKEGAFRSRTLGFPDGRFVRETLAVRGGDLQQVTLTESSGRSQNIETRVSVVCWDGQLVVHVNLNMYTSATILAPARVIPRCPKIVQSLLRLPIKWLLNNEPAPSGLAQVKDGESGGQYVGDEVNSSTRAAPVILVSQYEGSSFWPTLARDLASDLAGVANVMEVDDEAAEAVEEDVGRKHRCFGGAVRLFWPKDLRSDTDKLQSELWTTRHLGDLDQDGFGKERFREILRERIMEVAALTVTAPRSIRLIQNAAANEFIEELRSTSDPETVQIVELYAQQNEVLRRELEEARDSIARQTAKYGALQHAYRTLEVSKSRDADVDADESHSDDRKIIQDGETRIVKKLSGTSGPYDRMVEWGGCNHSSWEAMGNAPKALKGIQRLFKENANFKKVEKCLTCTGGGVWRVTW